MRNHFRKTIYLFVLIGFSALAAPVDDFFGVVERDVRPQKDSSFCEQAVLPLLRLLALGRSSSSLGFAASSQTPTWQTLKFARSQRGRISPGG
jgi:hypothetical protein